MKQVPQSGGAASNWSGPALIPLGHHKGKPPIRLHRPVMVIGARKDAHIHLISKSVSQTHAIFVINGNHVYVRDMASRMHVYINGEQVREADLSDGDTIKVGDFEFQVKLGAPAEPAPPAPDGMLEIESEGLPSALSGKTTIIGRRASNDIVFEDESVSTVHAVIAERAGVRLIRDLGSRTGTFVNGAKIHQTEISFGDEIRIGPAVIRYQASAAGGAAAMQEEQQFEQPADEVSLDDGMTVPIPSDEQQEAPQEEPQAAAPAHQEEPFEVPALEPAPAAQEEELPSMTVTPTSGVGDLTALPMAPIEVEEEQPAATEQDLTIPVPEEPTSEEPATEQLAPLSIEEEQPEAAVEEEQEVQETESEPVEEQEAEAETEEELPPLSFDESEAEAEPVAVAPRPTLPPIEPIEDSAGGGLSFDEADVPPLAMGEIEESPDEPIAPAKPAPRKKTETAPAAAAPAMDLDFSVPEFEMPTVEPLDFGAASAAGAAASGLDFGGDDGAGGGTNPPASRMRGGASTSERAPSSMNGGLTFEAEPAAEVGRLGVVPDVEDVSDLGFGPSVVEPPPPPKPAAKKKYEAPKRTPGPAIPKSGPKPDAEIPSIPLDAPVEPLAIGDVDPLPLGDVPGLALGAAAAGAIVGSAATAIDDVPPLDLGFGAAPAAAPKKPTLKTKAAAPTKLRKAPAAEAPKRVEPKKVEPPPALVTPPPAPVEVEPPPPPPPPASIAVEEPAIKMVEEEPLPVVPLSEAAGTGLAAVLESPTEATHITSAPMPAPIDISSIEDLRVESAAGQVVPPPPPETIEEIPQDQVHDAMADLLSEFEQPGAAPEIPPAPEPSESIEATGLSEGSGLLASPIEEGDRPKRWWSQKRESKPGTEIEPVTEDATVAPTEGVEGSLTAAPQESVLSPEDLTITAAPPAEDLGTVSPQNAGAMPPPVEQEPPPMGSLGGVLDLGADQLGYFGGMPLSLNELQGPPSTFGRVSYDFGDRSVKPAPQPTQAPQAPQAAAPSAPVEPPAQEDWEAALAEPEPFAPEAPVADDDFTVDFEEPAPPAPVAAPPPVAPPAPKAPPKPTAPPQTKTPPRPKLSSLSGAASAPLADEELPGEASAEAFQGLAMPPMRDVFSPLPGPGADDPVFGGGGATTATPRTAKGPSIPPPKAPTPSAAADAGILEDDQMALPAEDDGWASGLTAEPEAPVAPAAPAAPKAPKKQPKARPAPQVAIPAAAIPRPRKRRLPRVSVLLLIMLLCMAAAGAAIWYLVPKKAKFEGTLNFRNFDRLTPRDQALLRDEQRQILLDPGTRSTAAQIVENLGPPKIAGGFLSDPLAFGKLVSAAESSFWPDEKKGTFTLTMDSRDPDGDKARIKALLTVMYLAKSNAARVQAASRASEMKDLTAQSARLKERIGELAGMYAEQERLSKTRPPDAQLKELEELSAEREKAWQLAAASVLQLQFQIDQLRKGDAGATSTATDDPELKQLEEQMATATKAISAARSASHSDLDEAKRSLDMAIEQFQQQTQATQDRAKDYPELKAYLIAATDLKEATRQLTGELIQSQKDQHERLMDMQRRLQEQLDRKRGDQFKNDTELKDLNEQLGLTRRKYNASLSKGSEQEQETAALKAEVARLEERVAARQKALGGVDDAFFVDTLTQLQEEIARSQKALDENQARAQQTLDRLQKNFQSAAPAVEKLPAEQKELAAGLQKRLAEIEEARKAYTTAMENKAAKGDVKLAELQTAAGEIQHKIELRKQALEAKRAQNLDQQEQSKLQLIQRRTTELESAKKTATDAETALLKSRMDVVLVKQAKETADHAAEARDNYQAEMEQAKADLARLNERLTNRNSDAKALSFPEEPTADNVKMLAEQDPRIQVAAVSGGGIAFVFILLMFFAAKSPANEQMPIDMSMLDGLTTE